MIVSHLPSCYNLPITGESSSGRTADSGSVSEGSNPSSPASKKATENSQLAINILKIIYGRKPIPEFFKRHAEP